MRLTDKEIKVLYLALEEVRNWVGSGIFYVDDNEEDEEIKENLEYNEIIRTSIYKKVLEEYNKRQFKRRIKK